MTSYFPVHAHSAYSVMDGMGSVQDMVGHVADLGMPAMALTDHGTMAGTIQAYQAARKAGILFYPGCEFYVVQDVGDKETVNKRWHLGMLALDFEGYKALVALQTRSWSKERFYRKPLLDLTDFADLYDAGLTKHLAVTTGCYSGMVIDQWQGDDPAGMAERRVKVLRSWFPNLYVELQNHGITWPCGTTDLDIAEELHSIARRLGLPVLAGADSHYLHPHQQSAHDLMKDICYFGAGEDIHFSGGPYGIVGWEDTRKSFPDAGMQTDILAGHQDLLDKHEVSIPPLDNYKFRVPKISKDPNTELTDLVDDFLTNQNLAYIHYLERAAIELDVIAKMGMADYFLLVKTHVSDWCKDNNVIINTRGSANGSLVCYALGITTVDPLKWNTSFDRFLSLDRMKPPDIDVDVDFEARQKLLEHLRHIFPSSQQIGTYGKVGLGVSAEGEDSGSIIVQYMAAMSRKVPGFAKKVLPEHRQPLNELSAGAVVYKGMGTHAAGIVLPGDDLPVTDYLPLGRVVSSDTTVTQYAKDDVEALGYVKVDILGLRMLQVLNNCLGRIGRKPNEWKWIRLNDAKACALLRSGNGVGLFQFEGSSLSWGGKEMKIKNTLDAVLALALYRPALMRGGQKDLYLHNRTRPLAEQVRLHPVFDPIVHDTAGVPLYQEQIMEILRSLGMAYVDYNDLMSAIKASNAAIHGAADTFDRLQPVFYDLAIAKGLTEDDADSLWDSVVGFTEYGFNRAHSTSYGLMAYYSAYLKAHYPLEYMASLLGVWAENEDKVRLYVKEAKRLGISVIRADVNFSGATWDVDASRKQALRKGLVSLKGVGPTAAQAVVAERVARGPYQSVKDFVTRTPRRPVSGGSNYAKTGELTGVCKVLAETGALRSLGTE